MRGARAARAPRDRARAGRRARRARILLVEDSDIVRESLRRLLERPGYDVTEARDGAEASSSPSAGEFDLVSTDVMMPRMDGYELTRALRADARVPRHAHRDGHEPRRADRPRARLRRRRRRVHHQAARPHELLRAVAHLLGHSDKGGWMEVDGEPRDRLRRAGARPSSLAGRSSRSATG